MSVKAYCGAINPLGYGGDPVDALAIEVAIKIFNTDGPGVDEQSVTLNLPLGGTEMDLCTMMYQSIVDRCNTLSWPVPTTDDVFCIRSIPISREYLIS